LSRACLAEKPRSTNIRFMFGVSWKSRLNGGYVVATRWLLIVSIVTAAVDANGAPAQVPPAIAAPGETKVATFHGEGAQIYECRGDSDGRLTWVFREPIATLLLDNKTVGHHYAGPTWEDTDGSAVTGTVVGDAPGATAKDIPWLKLDVASRHGNGLLADVITVQRINTHGGVMRGVCHQAGAFRSVLYSADYVFLRVGG
jgi:Protein of unknown function (DUF3455)